MKLLTIVSYAVAAFITQAFGNDPNVNGLLRNPSSHGTTTTDGASFGPEPVLRTLPRNDSSPKEDTNNNPQKDKARAQEDKKP